MILVLLEACVAVVIVGTIVTQVIIPTLKGEPMFPFLRSHGINADREKSLQQRKKELERELELEKLEGKVDDLERKKNDAFEERLRNLRKEVEGYTNLTEQQTPLDKRERTNREKQ